MIKIFLNNEDITQNVEKGTFNLKEELNYKVDTLSFDVIKSKSKTIPKNEDTITVKKNNRVIFSGFVDKVKGKISGNKTAIFSIEASDLTSLLSRKLVIKIWKEKTITEIINDLLANEIAELGITAGSIDPVETNLKKVVADYKKVSEIINDFAKYSLGYWRINPNKTLDFKIKGTEKAPYDIIDGNDTYLPNTLQIDYSTEQLANVVYVIGGEYVSESITENIGTANGEQTNFRLPYVYDELPRVWVDTTEKTVGIKNLHKTGYECYWDRKNKSLDFETAPVVNAKIKVQGKPLIPLVSRQTRGGQGKRYEKKIIDKTITSRAGVEARGKAELDQYAEAITKGTFKTYKDGFKTGQSLTVTSHLLDISDEYIVTSMRTEIKNKDTLVYTISINNKDEYDLLDLFRYLLSSGEKNYGVFKDSETILLDYIGQVEKLVAKEKYEIKYYDAKGNDKAKVSDDLFFNDIEYQWVWGEYQKQGRDDPKSSPRLDYSGARWEN